MLPESTARTTHELLVEFYASRPITAGDLDIADEL
jgi:hypothetical protein